MMFTFGLTWGQGGKALKVMGSRLQGQENKRIHDAFFKFPLAKLNYIFDNLLNTGWGVERGTCSDNQKYVLSNSNFFTNWPRYISGVLLLLLLLLSV